MKRYPQMTQRSMDAFIFYVSRTYGDAAAFSQLMGYMKSMSRRRRTAHTLAALAPWTADQLFALYQMIPPDMWFMHKATYCPHGAMYTLNRNAWVDRCADWRFALLLRTAAVREGSEEHVGAICERCFVPSQEDLCARP